MGIKSFVKRTATKLLNHESEYSKNVRKATGDTRSAAQVKKDALKSLRNRLRIKFGETSDNRTTNKLVNEGKLPANQRENVPQVRPKVSKKMKAKMGFK